MYLLLLPQWHCEWVQHWLANPNPNPNLGKREKPMNSGRKSTRVTIDRGVMHQSHTFIERPIKASSIMVLCRFASLLN